MMGFCFIFWEEVLGGLCVFVFNRDLYFFFNGRSFSLSLTCLWEVNSWDLKTITRVF